MGRRLISDTLDKLGMALLAGNLDFPTAFRRAKAQATAGTFEVFILFPLLEFGFLERKPLCNRMPRAQKQLVFLLPRSKIAGKNAEQRPEIH